MRIYKTIYIEDNKSAIEVMTSLLEPYKDMISIQATAGTPEEAKSILMREQFDISILDIDLFGKNCFDILNDIPRSRFGEIIFCTAHGKVNINEMLDVHPIYYLEKPFSSEKVNKMMVKITNAFSQKSAPLDEIEIYKDNTVKRIFIKLRDIFYIESDRKRSIYYYIDSPGKFSHGSRPSGLVKQLESLNDKFEQCHRSFIINLDYLKEYEPSTNGLTVIMPNSKTIEISRSFKDRVLAKKGLIKRG